MKTIELEAARVRALVFSDRVRATNHACVHGHFGCSDVEGGFCLDEMFSRLGLDNDGEWAENSLEHPEGGLLSNLPHGDEDDLLGIGRDGLLDHERDL